VAFLNHGGKTFQVLGLAPPAVFTSVESLMQSTAASFAPLSDPAALSVQPARLRIITLASAMSVAELAARYPSLSAERLAILNQTTANARLYAGQKVKVVEGKVREDKK
jgi:predicted Zn-dependent protease